MNSTQKLISEIMTRSMCQVGPTQTAIDALARMRSKSVSSVLVVENGAIKGIITERDIVRAVHNHASLETLGCTELMQSPVVSVDPTTPCLEAYQQMAGRGIRHLAVTDKGGKVLGLASEGDLMRDFGIEYYLNFKDIGSVMSPDTCTLRETALVADAVKLMIENNQSCVLVVDGGKRPIGIVTERDIVRLCGEHMHSERLVVGEVMHAPVKTVQPTAVLHEAVKSMRDTHIRRLVVVDDEGVVAGLLTHHEIVRGLQGDLDGHFKALAELQTRHGLQATPLIDQELILSSVLGSTGSCVIAAGLDFRICCASSSVVGILGLDPKEVIGLDLRDVMKQVGLPNTNAVICEAALAVDTPTFDTLFGTVKVSVRLILLRNQEGACGFLALAQRVESP